jgi:hypothetical protein
MSTGAPIEIVYERPAAPPRRWVIVAGAALFVALTLWVTASALPGPWWVLVAVAIGAGVLGAQLALGGAGVLATRRVTADAAGTLRIEHRRGERAVALSAVTEIAHGKVTAADGVALDAVTLTLRGGAAVAFGVASPEAAEGAARAIRALVDEADGAEAAGSGQSA